MDGWMVLCGRMRRKLRLLAVRVMKLEMAMVGVVKFRIMTLKFMKQGDVKTVRPINELDKG
jgi:hypothetical protein